MRLSTEIANPEAGERIVFDEAAAMHEKLVWNEFRPPKSEPPPAHYHFSSEGFRGCEIIAE